MINRADYQIGGGVALRLRTQDGADRRRSDLSKRLARIKRETRRAVDAILENPRSQLLQERLAELEREQEETEAALAGIEPPPVIEFHPSAADSYRKKVRDLRAALAECGEDDKAEATAAIRELVDKVTITPTGPYGPVDLTIHGRLATLLEASRNGTVKRPESMGAMVAGVRFVQARTSQVLRRNV